MYSAAEEQSFVGWMRQNNHLYTGEEYKLRLGIYLTNQRKVREFNSNSEHSFKIGMNKLSALTPSEYRSLLGDRTDAKPVKATSRASTPNGDSVDWRKKGVVNHIKDQGQCGSCWTFGAVQTLESNYAIKNGKLPVFSEQNLVDCVTSCYGCGGGLAREALSYVLENQNGKIMLESDYPYRAVQQACKYDSSKAFNTGIKSVAFTTPNSESDLAAKVESVGPVSISIDASHSSFQLYTGGIYDETACSSVSLDHAVGCVGFGKEGGQNYWIVRNSWGEDWGESGYIRMIKDKNNQCGVATRPTYPVI